MKGKRKEYDGSRDATSLDRERKSISSRCSGGGEAVEIGEEQTKRTGLWKCKQSLEAA